MPNGINDLCIFYLQIFIRQKIKKVFCNRLSNLADCYESSKLHESWLSEKWIKFLWAALMNICHWFIEHVKLHTFNACIFYEQKKSCVYYSINAFSNSMQAIVREKLPSFLTTEDSVHWGYFLLLHAPRYQYFWKNTPWEWFLKLLKKSRRFCCISIIQVEEIRSVYRMNLEN